MKYDEPGASSSNPNAEKSEADMTTATYPGIVENGQIRLGGDVRLPEKATVYVVVPGNGTPSVVRVGSPRLADPNQSADFAKSVTPEIPDAEV